MQQKLRKKQNQELLVLEVIKDPIQYIILICKTGLFIAEHYQSITNISGYHHYTLKTAASNFGIGGLKPLKTTTPPGMFESLSRATGIPYKTIAISYGEALLKLTET